MSRDLPPRLSKPPVLITSLASSAASSKGGTWTLLWISIMMTAVGAILAFDIGGIASANHRNNTGRTPWGRKLQTSKWPDANRIVGWIFLVPGAALLVLAIAAGIVTLIHG
jgi:hypothetical protein